MTQVKYIRCDSCEKRISEAEEVAQGYFHVTITPMGGPDDAVKVPVANKDWCIECAWKHAHSLRPKAIRTPDDPGAP